MIGLNRSHFGVFPFGIFSITAFGLCVWVGFMITDCAPKPRILPQDRTSENVLRCARQNTVEFTSLAGLLDLQLKGKAAKYSGTVEIYYQAPDTFAFYPRSFFGMNIFEAFGQDDSLTVYFPKENQYFTGKYSDLENTRLWSWHIPFRLLSDLILGKGGLSDSNLVYFCNTRDWFGYRSEDENWIKEYYIDAGKCRLTKSKLTRKKNGEYYLIDFKSYKKYGQGENPEVVRVVSSIGDVASIKFREMKFDFSVPERKLKLQIPSDSKRVELQRNER